GKAPDEIPPGVFVGPGHAWLHLEHSGEAAIGAGRLPVMLLGGLDRVEVKPPGSEVECGEPVVVLHRGTRTLSLRTPVSGTVSRVNPEVETDPQQIAANPFAEGWLLKLRPRELSSAVKQMFVAEEAVAWIRQELRRLRDTIAGLPGQVASPATAGLPDGGLPVEGVAVSLSGNAWESLCDEFFAVDPNSERQTR
ncbi:MAG: hypothetical protein GY838_19480, partial [bacterium]|nr:hypothetical protein [bacterium]